MAIRKELDGLLTKPMDRKDFLKHVGVGIIAVTGVAAVIRTLGSLGAAEPTTAKPIAVTRKRGYGNSGYGSKTEIA